MRERVPQPPRQAAPARLASRRRSIDVPDRRARRRPGRPPGHSRPSGGSVPGCSQRGNCVAGLRAPARRRRRATLIASGSTTHGPRSLNEPIARSGERRAVHRETYGSPGLDRSRNPAHSTRLVTCDCSALRAQSLRQPAAATAPRLRRRARGRGRARGGPDRRARRRGIDTDEVGPARRAAPRCSRSTGRTGTRRGRCRPGSPPGSRRRWSDSCARVHARNGSFGESTPARRPRPAPSSSRRRRSPRCRPCRACGRGAVDRAALPAHGVAEAAHAAVGVRDPVARGRSARPRCRPRGCSASRSRAVERARRRRRTRRRRHRRASSRGRRWCAATPTIGLASCRSGRPSRGSARRRRRTRRRRRATSQ